MAVAIQTTGALKVGRPVPLSGFSGAQRWAGFDVLPNGQFVANISEVSAGEQPLRVVLNWTVGLTKR